MLSEGHEDAAGAGGPGSAARSHGTAAAARKARASGEAAGAPRRAEGASRKALKRRRDALEEDSVSEVELEAAVEAFALPAATEWPPVDVPGAAGESVVLLEGFKEDHYDADWARLEHLGHLRSKDHSPQLVALTAGPPPAGAPRSGESPAGGRRPAPKTRSRAPAAAAPAAAPAAGTASPVPRFKSNFSKQAVLHPDGSHSKDSSQTNDRTPSAEPVFITSESKLQDSEAEVKGLQRQTIDVPGGMQSVGVAVPKGCICMEVFLQAGMRGVTFFVPGDTGRARNEKSISAKKGRTSVYLPIPYGATLVKLCRLPKGTEQVAYKAYPKAEEWLCCDKCDKWRRVSVRQHAEATRNEDTPWQCDHNECRPGAQCQEKEESWEEGEGWTYAGNVGSGSGPWPGPPRGKKRKASAPSSSSGDQASSKVRRTRNTASSGPAKLEFKKQVADLVLPLVDGVLIDGALKDLNATLVQLERSNRRGPRAKDCKVVKALHAMRIAAAGGEVANKEAAAAVAENFKASVRLLAEHDQGDAARLQSLSKRFSAGWGKVHPQLATFVTSYVVNLQNGAPKAKAGGGLERQGSGVGEPADKKSSTSAPASGSSSQEKEKEKEKEKEPWLKFNIEEDRARFKPGSVKASIFHVLFEAQKSGLSVSQIVSTTQALGLKDWTGVATPKCTVSAACSTDPIFVRVAPGTFALRAIPGVIEVPPLSHHSRNASNSVTARRKARMQAEKAKATTKGPQGQPPAPQPAPAAPAAKAKGRQRYSRKEKPVELSPPALIKTDTDIAGLSLVELEMNHAVDDLVSSGFALDDSFRLPTGNLFA